MISQSVQSILEKRRAEAERNRALMPTVAAWLDGLREFFPGARIVFAEENGHAVGVKKQWYEVSAVDVPREQWGGNKPDLKQPSKGVVKCQAQIKQRKLLE